MNKVKPQHMSMSEAVPFGQRWNYYSDHPLNEMINPEYFRTFTGLRAGDDMRVCHVENEKTERKIKSYADLLVVETKPLRFHLIDKVVIDEVDGLHIKQGTNCWELWNGELKVDEYPNLEAAEEGMKFYKAA